MTGARRVVVTGAGAVSPFGWTLADFRQGRASAACALAPTVTFDTTGQRTNIAGEVAAAPPALVDRLADWPRLSRTDRFAVAAAVEACDHAGVRPAGHRTGVFFGTSTAGMAECEDYLARTFGAVEGRPRVRSLAAQQLNAPGDAVARQLGVTGPVEAVSSACSSGALAIGAALDALRSGEIDVAVAGGADGLCLLTYSGFNALRLVDPGPCVPFREARRGMNLGEGAGALVLESEEHAVRRGAAPLAELLGAGASCDAHHMTAPHPDGEGSYRALVAALADAGIEADDVTFVNAHGTGTEQNDVSESKALVALLGERFGSIPVVATKGAIGHLLGSSGAIEAVDTVLCLRDGVLHPAPGAGGAVDEACGVNLVLESGVRIPEGSVAVSTSFAFGGSNAALVFVGIRSGEGS